MEKERDETKEEAQVARQAAFTMGDAKARVEDDLAVAEKARCKAKAETGRLEVERTSLLLDLRVAKCDASKPEGPLTTR